MGSSVEIRCAIFSVHELCSCVDKFPVRYLRKKLTIHFIALMQLAESKEATQEMLLDVHTQEYLDRLNTSSAAIASVRTAGLKPDLL